MVAYVIVFWVSLIGHPGLVDKVVIPHAGSPQSCGFAAGEAQDWTDKHPAWVLLSDELHHPHCVEKREL